MTIMPGAVWRPIAIPGGAPRRTSKGRAVILHVAVSESASLFSFFNNNASANSHFYVTKAGVIEQYVDTDYQSWASAAANQSTISVETQGGVTNADAEPWTAAQIAALGRICAWAHATEGVPLQIMPNSLPASRGIGYHRLGINPWVVAGGQIWSSSAGKLCPGAAKIAQIPQIVAAASGTTPEDIELDANQAAQLTNVTNAVAALQVAVMDPTSGVKKLVGDVHGKVVDSVFDLSGRPGPDKDDLLGQVLSIRAEVAGLAAKVAKVQAGGVDAKQVAALVIDGIKAIFAAPQPPA